MQCLMHILPIIEMVLDIEADLKDLSRRVGHDIFTHQSNFGSICNLVV